MHGGKFLGQGSFGCVVSPPLRCRRTLFKYPYSIDKRYISKIVEYDSNNEELLDEITLGQKLIQLDNRQKYFSPILTACLLEKQKHSDIVFKESNSESFFDNSNSNSYDSSNDSTNKKRSHSRHKERKCRLSKNLDYINFISKFGGIELKKVINKPHRHKKEIEYIQKHYYKIFKHLLSGLVLLHKNQIIHKDVKPDNMLIKLENSGRKANVVFIDFGLSEVFEKNDYSERNLRYKISGGTRLYTPPEIIMLISILDVILKNKKGKNKISSDDVYKKFNRRYNSIIEYWNQEFDNYNVSRIENKKYIDKNLVKTIFKNISRNYNSNAILDAVISKKNGIIYKWDVFSLGLVFYKLVKVCQIDDHLANDLISKMVEPNYQTRLMADELLIEPFFTKNQDSKRYHRKSTIQKETSKIVRKQKRKSLIKKLKQ